jgi:YVTN family beta-propeller protein
MTTVTVGNLPQGVAITPDGKHVYVSNSDGTVSVIDTTKNPPSVVATVVVGIAGVAVTPDGKHVYVVNFNSNNVSVIDTASNMVVATVTVGFNPIAVAITPDGKRAYVANSSSPGTVSVIDTASNMVVATVTVGNIAQGVPWETRLCRESKLRQRFGDRHGHEPPVVATVVVGNGQTAVCIGPPPTCVPFLAFSAKLEINLERKPNKDRFELLSSFTLGSASNGINPVTDAVTLEAGTFTTTIPAGSFKEIGLGIFVFHGVIGGVRLEALIAPTGSLRYALVAAAQDANLTGTKNPVPVSLTIGDDCGTASVESLIIH